MSNKETEQPKNSRTKRVAIWTIIGGVAFGAPGALIGAGAGFLSPIGTRK